MEHTDYPALYQIADASSLRGQRWYKRLTAAQLVFILLGGLTGVVAASGGPLASAGALFGAISFLGAGAATLLARQGAFEEDWFNGRAVAETVKSLTWRYMTRTPPFDDDAAADSTFLDQLGETMRMRTLQYHHMGAAGASATQITPVMRSNRSLDAHASLELYRQARLRDQAEWYRSRAQRHGRGRDAWFVVALAGQAAAVLLAVLSAFSTDVANLNLLGLAASVVASATAWGQVNRHDEQGRAYALAYQELLLVLSLQPSTGSPDEITRFVSAGESAISREHTLWIGKRTEPVVSESGG